MLQLRNAGLDYGNTHISFPDLTLEPGQRLGLFGPSGLGKSSLAKVLAGIEPLSQGELTLPGFAQGSANPVQWVIQQSEFAFNPRLSIRQSLRESWRNDDFMGVLDRYGVDPLWLNRRPLQVSGGQLQRVNLVRAIIPSTEYLICDEITAHLDMITQQQIWLALGEEAGQRRLGLLVISHDEELLNLVCDDVLNWTG
ncbi:putative dipeptide ABC transporter [Shewanella sediminis HAW-EB3]|uniref:Putative dipeptide ABC transporter n=1 Tax=Shewanella sediminis (strain HAW-EB3) TaxID=425104 RepID=A8FTW7_SHESH|nr:ATP-binding cassette domain-containing protein [Shewanella sediminis]ABV36290.1 putative dipeptide ABC transporter [Shewanella sediminis HAW-EB3]